MHSSGTFPILLRFTAHASLQLFFQTFHSFAIYRIIFGVGDCLRGFFVCSECKCSICVSVLFCFYLLQKLNSPLYVKGAGPGLFSLGAFPTFRSTIFCHGCLYVESNEGGREGLKRFVTVVA